MGVPAAAAAEPRDVSALHQVDQPPARHLQAGGFQGRVPPLGFAQKQARHELRDHGPGAEVSGRFPHVPNPLYWAFFMFSLGRVELISEALAEALTRSLTSSLPFYPCPPPPPRPPPSCTFCSVVCVCEVVPHVELGFLPQSVTPRISRVVVGYRCATFHSA